MFPDLNNFMQKRLNVKSKDCRSALPKWKHSRLHRKVIARSDRYTAWTDIWWNVQSS